MTKLSELQAASSTDTGDELYVVQGGNSRRSKVAHFFNASSFLQSGTGAVARSYLNKNRWRVDVEDYGDVDTDALGCINRAITYVNGVQGGGEVRFEAREYSLTGAPTIKTGVRLVGKGSANTRLKLGTNANTPVLKTLDFDTLVGGGTTGGPSDWAVIGLTLDGNRANQSGAADPLNGISAYGLRYLVEDVMIRDVKGHGLRSEWAVGSEGTGSSAGMEATVRRLKIDTCGRHGVRWEGPHDSFGEDWIIIDAGQEADNTFDGLLLQNGGQGRWVNVHCWHRGATTNRMFSSARVESGGNEFFACHFEGGRRCLIQRGDRNTYKAMNIYGVFSTNPMVTIRGSHVFFEARIEDTIPSGAPCLQIGESGIGGLFFSHLNVLAITAATNAVVISDDDGRNTGIIKTVSATNAYSGSWSSDSDVLIQKPDGTLEDRGVIAHAGARTFSSQVTAPTINLTSGQIIFPASQNASSNANTLDDYEEGTWTPGLTFATPGT